MGFKADQLPQTDSATKHNIIPSMGAAVLKEHMLPKFPWVSKLLLFKKLRKIYSAYILPALNLNVNGYLYMDMKQNGTISGRFACSGGFNLQTLPRAEESGKCPECGSKAVKEEADLYVVSNVECPDCGYKEQDKLCPSAIKAGFIAPQGYKIINADYSSLEPRLFAFTCGDQKLKEVYWKGLDLYSKVYCDMLDTAGRYSANPNDENYLGLIDKKKRTMIKPVVLSIPYGAEDGQVAHLMGMTKTVTNKEGNTSVVTDYEKGAYYRNLYLSTYSKLHDYMIGQEIKALEFGYVESLIGRRRHFMFTRPVFELLAKKHISYKDFLAVNNKNLVGVQVKVSVGSRETVFSKDELQEICRLTGIRYQKAEELDGWRFIKSKFKDELNNSKNFPIQSMAGHVANKGMLEIKRGFEKAGIDGYIFLQVHDEISAYVREDQASEAAISAR